MQALELKPDYPQVREYQRELRARVDAEEARQKKAREERKQQEEHERQQERMRQEAERKRDVERMRRDAEERKRAEEADAAAAAAAAAENARQRSEQNAADEIREPRPGGHYATLGIHSRANNEAVRTLHPSPEKLSCRQGNREQVHE